MAAVAAGARRPLLSKAAGAVAARRKAPGRQLGAALAAAREHVVTVAALSSIDFGVFRASSVAGWIVCGVSLLVLDFAIRG